MKFLVVLLLFSSSLGVPIIQSSLFQKFADGKVSIMLTFEPTTTILEKIENINFNSRGERAQAVYDALNAHARNSQKEVIETLTKEEVEFESLWISNQINLPAASLNTFNKLTKLSKIYSINEEAVAKISYVIENKNVTKNVNKSIYEEWGLLATKAREACKAGKCGNEVKVLVIDTGMRGTHEAIRNAQHKGYSWYDPVQRTTIPTDIIGHGTHVTGTILGAGGINGVGVATQAKWQGCVGCPGNDGCPQTALTKCAQFGICPHPPNQPDLVDCNQVTHIASNSWAGSPGQIWFNPSIDAWRAADIVPVFAIGNYGEKGCGSANYPGDNAKVIGVGSVNWYVEPDSNNYTISYFSSRGPTLIGERIKPDIAAPGYSIFSAGHISDAHYMTLSGTSMACPHVTGAVAILKSKNPKASYDEILKTLTNTANKDVIKPTNENCGRIPDNKYPNNNAGAGLLDCNAALKELPSTSVKLNSMNRVNLIFLIYLFLFINEFKF